MLYVEESGDRGPLVLMLHWLGGSASSWHEVSVSLATAGFRCVAVDLPGFGHSQQSSAFSVPQMVAALIETIRHLRHPAPDTPWLLAGHSMGGKLAMLIARAAEQGEPGLTGLQGLMLVSPSPPGPEPMQESKRAETIQALGSETTDPDQRRKHAEKFVDDNTGKLPLLDHIRERSVDDLLRMNPEALVAWMTTGSRLDSSGQVGRLSLSALVLSGTEESALGPDAQMQHTLPHLPAAALVSLEGGGHLAPLERPHEVADRMIEFFHTLGLPSQPQAATLSNDFAALIDSGLTAPQTRTALLGRLQQNETHAAGVLTLDELRTLRALAACVVPGSPFDLAGRVDRALAQLRHDGWRFNTLPADPAAWKLGLTTLDHAARREHGVPFLALDILRQNVLLQQAQAGDLGRGILALVGLGDSARDLDAQQMRDWFEDVRSEFTKLYTADPRTLQRIGFTGFADEAGFTHITLEDQQEVQP